MADEAPFYVYAIMDGEVCLYVGKGTGRRAKTSAIRHGGFPVIIRRFRDEDAAFSYEKEMIAELLPQNNKCGGGNGGRKSNNPIPPSFRGKISQADMRREARSFRLVERGMREIGPRKFVANMLLNEFANFISPSKLDAIRQVAHGGWA